MTDRDINIVDVKKILIIAIGGIGDILRLFPVITVLRNYFPRTELSLLTPFHEHHDIWSLLPKAIRIEKKVQFDVEGIHKTIMSKFRLIRNLQRQNFDLIIDTSRGNGMAPNAIMSFLIGGSNRVGFQKKGIGFLHHKKIHFKDHEYIGEQNLRLLSAIGIDGPQPHIKIQFSSVDSTIASQYPKLQKPTITIHPGAKWNGWHRVWPHQKYAALVKLLTQELGAVIILLGDSKEKDLTGKIVNAVNIPNVLDLAGKTSLIDAAHIIKHSSLFIGNDSSLLHIAVALQTPSIGIFGSTSPQQVMPNSPHFRPIYLKLSCSPCYIHQPLYETTCEHKKCLTTLAVDDVMAIVRPMMATDTQIVPRNKTRSFKKKV